MEENKKKRGRPKAIPTPEILWEHFKNYKKSVKENPFYLVEQKKGNTIIPKGFDGEINADMFDSTVNLPIMRPLTMEGFENWLEDNEIVNDINHYLANTEGRYSGFITICSRIRRVIRQDQIEGGMANLYNASITQRLNGLTDKQEVKIESDTLSLSVEEKQKRIDEILAQLSK